METETLFLVISISLVIQIFIVLSIRINWLLILLSSLGKISYEIMMWYSMHFKMNQILIFYYIVCIVGSFVAILISYHREFTLKTEFFWNSKIKFKKYLFNILYNIDQGFLSFKNNKIMFINRTMKKILKDNEFDSNINSENEFNQSFFAEFLNDFQSFEDVVNNKDNSSVSLEMFFKESKIEIMLENLFSNFTEINEKLPKIYKKS